MATTTALTPRRQLKPYRPGSHIPNPCLAFYGLGGSGKTTLIGTMPGRGLVVDVPTIEGGTYVLEDKADRIMVLDVTTFDEIDDIYWAIQRQDETALPGVKDLNWIAIDSITAMQELAKRKVIGERDIPQADHKVSPQDWGYTGQLVGELIYRFNKLPNLTKIYTAQQRKFGSDDETNEPVMLGPAVLPSVLTPLMQPMFLLGRTFVTTDDEGKEQFLMRTGHHDLYLTKARSFPGKRLPAIIKEPNLGGILRYMFSDGKKPRAYTEASGIILG